MGRNLKKPHCLAIINVLHATYMVKKNKDEKEITIRTDPTEAGSWDQFSDEAEGQLSVDVFQDESNLYVKAPIAGVKPDNLELTVTNDLLTIRGRRQDDSTVPERDYFVRECFWGRFSRSIILPTEVKSDQITAALENGVLTITLPKLERKRHIPITITNG